MSDLVKLHRSSFAICLLRAGSAVNNKQVARFAEICEKCQPRSFSLDTRYVAIAATNDSAVRPKVIRTLWLVRNATSD